MIIVVLGILFAVAVLVILLVMLLRRKLREKYATLWLVIGTAMLILALFPGLLGWLAGVLGVAVPSNLLFAMAIALLVGVALHLSWELSTAEDEVRRVAEDVAITEAEVQALRDRVSRIETRLEAADGSRSATDD